MYNSKIAVVLPTRNRPELLERFVSSVFNTASKEENIKFYLYVDDDDLLTPSAILKLQSRYKDKIFVLTGPRILMSKTANELLPSIKEDIFFCGGDDLILRTKNWDQMVIKKFDEIEDKIGLVFGDDLNQKDLATHPILHRRWVECLGYLTPPYFSSDYADTWLTELADGLNRKYKLEFINEHMHFTIGKSPLDATYLEGRTRFHQDNAPELYRSLQGKRTKDLNKLKDLLNIPYGK
jgi:glycosyltransferase involved in cell wall biosynthesis